MEVNGDRTRWLKLRSRDGWLRRAWELGQQLRPAASRTDRLVVVGTETFDAWHVAAHLDDEARLLGVSSLRPTLLRWNPPPGAAPHLAHSAAELQHASRRQTILVVAPDEMSADALERVGDARRRGANVFAVAAADHAVASVTGDIVDVPAGDMLASAGNFEVATHLVTVSAGTEAGPARRRFSLNPLAYRAS